MSIEPVSQSLKEQATLNEQFQAYTRTCTHDCRIGKYKQYDRVKITEWTPDLLINFWTSVCRFPPSAKPQFDDKELKLLETDEPGFFKSLLSNQSMAINPNIFVSAAKASEKLRKLALANEGFPALEGNQILSKDAETLLRRHSYELEPYLRQGAIHIDNVAKKLDHDRTKALRTLGHNILTHMKENPVVSVDIIWTTELLTKFMDNLSNLDRNKKLAYDRETREFYTRSEDKKILGEDKICLDVMRHVARTLHLMTIVVGLNKKSPGTINPVLVNDAENFVRRINLIKETITKQSNLYNKLDEVVIAKEWGALHKEFFPTSKPKKPLDAIKLYYSCPVTTQEPAKKPSGRNRVLKWGDATKKAVSGKVKIVEESVTKILEKKKKIIETNNEPKKKKAVTTPTNAQGEVDESPSLIKPSKMSPRASVCINHDEPVNKFTLQLQRSISEKQLRRYSTSEVEALKQEGKLEGLFDPAKWEQEDKKIEHGKLERRNSFVEVMARNLLEQLSIKKILEHAAKLEKITITENVAATDAGDFELIPDEQDLEWEV